MKTYQIRKHSVAGKNTFKEIAWEGRSKEETARRMVDRLNYTAMKNDTLDYYELVEMENGNGTS